MATPLVSVIMWCHSRQKYLDMVLPGWLSQTYDNYEIVVLCGPGIKTPVNAKIRRIEAIPGDEPKICKAYNILLKEAKGEIILTTQADVEINSPTQISRMVTLCRELCLVSDRIIKEGIRDPGIYCYCLMGYKSAFDSIGGWCELYDGPDSCAHEDADLVASMLEKGYNLDIISTPEDEAPRHLDHPKPDYLAEPYKTRVENGSKIFWSRHKGSVMTLYAKQFARRMMTMRRINA